MKLVARRYDLDLLFTVAVLLSIGIIAVFSSSTYKGFQISGDYLYFFSGYLTRLLLGLVVLWFFMRMDYHVWHKFIWFALWGVLALLVLVLAIGHEFKGAMTRLGPIQPSELAKFVLVIYIADAMARKQERLNDFSYGFMPLIVVPCFTMLMVALGKDFGTGLAIFLIMFLIMWAGGARWMHLGFLLLAGGLVVAFLVLLAQNNAILNEYFAHVWKRFHVFVNPMAYAGGAGYQVVQGLTAFSLGGLFGAGPGHSVQKLSYLPDCHTDFIYAIIGEEFGLIGTTILLGIFLYLIIRALKIVQTAPDFEGYMLGFGMIAMIAVYVFINIMVTLNLMPVTGLPLPFISFAGNNLIVNLAAIGIILNISSQSRGVDWDIR